jgi:hypothetical protein
MILRKLRVLGVDRVASPEEEAIVYEAIDVRLKALHQLGTLWWKVSPTPTDVVLTAGVATATAPTDMLYPVSLKIRRNNEDFPLDIVSNAAFQDIGTKLDTGRPEKVVVYNGTLRFYPVPNENYTVKLVYQKIVDDTVAGAAPDLVAGAVVFLKTIIAYDVADDFGAPENRMPRLAAEAKEAKHDLRSLLPQRASTETVTVEYF